MKINKENLRSLIREQVQHARPDARDRHSSHPDATDEHMLGAVNALDDFYESEFDKLSATFTDQDEIKDHLAASLTRVFMSFMSDHDLDRRVDITEY